VRVVVVERAGEALCGGAEVDTQDLGVAAQVKFESKT